VSDAVSAVPGPPVGRAILAAVEGVVRGRAPIIELSVAAMLAGGHILIEDVPGSGKTTLGMALTHAVGGEFRRIQGTADLMPADITGSSIWNNSTNSFEFARGPIFANVVLVDELNRMPPRTQSAFLEAMDEGSVTVDGISHRLPDPFVVIGTQNPADQWGTYPIPQGQLDRFTIVLRPEAIAPEIERQVVREQLERPTVAEIRAVCTQEGVVALRREARRVHVEESVLSYCVAVVEGTRLHRSVVVGASTRSALALARCAQGLAILRGRNFVTPDDVRELAVPVLAHRLELAGERSSEGSESALLEVLADLQVPLIRSR
jgi:MoxR-like ATPase